MGNGLKIEKPPATLNSITIKNYLSKDKILREVKIFERVFFFNKIK